MFELKITLSLDSSLMALLSAAGAATGNRQSANTAGFTASAATAGAGANTTSGDGAGTASDGATTSGTATNGASPSSVETDAAGTPFDPERHTGTKVKSGLWRMKVGKSRPESEGTVKFDL